MNYLVNQLKLLCYEPPSATSIKGERHVTKSNLATFVENNKEVIAEMFSTKNVEYSVSFKRIPNTKVFDIQTKREDLVLSDFLTDALVLHSSEYSLIADVRIRLSDCGNGLTLEYKDYIQRDTTGENAKFSTVHVIDDDHIIDIGIPSDDEFLTHLVYSNSLKTVLSSCRALTVDQYVFKKGGYLHMLLHSKSCIDIFETKDDEFVTAPKSTVYSIISAFCDSMKDRVVEFYDVLSHTFGTNITLSHNDYEFDGKIFVKLKFTNNFSIMHEMQEGGKLLF